MDLLRIGDTKLKVTLTEADMEKYRLDQRTLDYDTTETRSAFWQILDEAKHETGFDAGGGRLFVQVYPSRGGGCEMYVTLLADEEETRTARRASNGVESLYRFECLPHLLAACRILRECGYIGESAAYALEGAYFLTVAERRRGELPEYAFLEEYGTRTTCGARLAHLCEHGRCLERSNAVERLSEL